MASTTVLPQRLTPPAAPAALHLRHRPALGPGERRGLPARQPGPAGPTDLPALLDGHRPGGGPAARRRAGLAGGPGRAAREPRPVIVVSGEQAPDAALMELSTVPAGLAAEAHDYLAHGGTANLGELAALPVRHRAARRRRLRGARARPGLGPASRDDRRGDHGRASTGRPRAHRGDHLLPGPRAGREHRLRRPPVRGRRGRGGQAAAGLVRQPPLRRARTARRARPGRRADRHRAGGRRQPPALAQAGGDEEAWDAGALAALDVPILQALCLTGPREQWAAADDGVSPLDAATQVAIPEFDGRLITVPFSFKETDADGLSRYVADPERAARVAGHRGGAGPAAAHPARAAAGGARAVLLPDQARPDRQRRRPGHPGQRGPAAASHARRGYDIGPLTGAGALPGVEPPDGDALIHAVIAAGGQDPDWLTDQQLSERGQRSRPPSTGRGSPSCPPRCGTR